MDWIPIQRISYIPASPRPVWFISFNGVSQTIDDIARVWITNNWHTTCIEMERQSEAGSHGGR